MFESVWLGRLVSKRQTKLNSAGSVAHAKLERRLIHTAFSLCAEPNA